MSKTKGNVIDPLELIDQYGTDALRFTLSAMAAPGRDIRLNEKRIEGYRNFGTKLWNAARYCEMNDALPKNHFDYNSPELALNKWIIQELNKTVGNIDKAMDGFRYDEAANAIYDFVWKTFCDWYLEFTKPILYGDDEAMIAEVRATTGWVLSESIKILNVFMPFITEELYAEIVPKTLKEQPLLMQAEWPSYEGDVLDDQKAGSAVQWLIDLVSEIRSVRADMNVPAGAKTSLLITGASEDTKALVDQYLSIIQSMARVEDISFDQDFPLGSVQSVVREATIALPIAELIDLDQERARLAKEIQKLETDIKKIDGKLGNEKFVANAPEEVIEEQKSRKTEAEATMTKLSHALAQLEKAA
jgi:valyl-tRNA synthetase